MVGGADEPRVRWAARDALPALGFRLKGARTWLTTTTNRARRRHRLGCSPRPPATCRRAAPGLLVAALRAPAPLLPCPRDRADSRPRPSANFSRCPRRLARPALAVAAAEQQEGSGRRAGRPARPCGRLPDLGAEGGGGGPRNRLSGTSARRAAALSPGPSPAAWRGRRVGALLRLSSGVAAGAGRRLRAWRPHLSLPSYRFLSLPPAPSVVPSPVEPSGARTWRGTLHPRPGPQTPPPPPSIILRTGNGLCIARGTGD